MTDHQAAHPCMHSVLEFRKARICAYPSILMSLAVRLLVSTPVTVLFASSEAMFRAARLTIDSDWARDAELCIIQGKKARA